MVGIKELATTVSLAVEGMECEGCDCGAVLVRTIEGPVEAMDEAGIGHSAKVSEAEAENILGKAQDTMLDIGTGRGPQEHFGGKHLELSHPGVVKGD